MNDKTSKKTSQKKSNNKKKKNHKLQWLLVDFSFISFLQFAQHPTNVYKTQPPKRGEGRLNRLTGERSVLDTGQHSGEKTIGGGGENTFSGLRLPL